LKWKGHQKGMENHRWSRKFRTYRYGRNTDNFPCITRRCVFGH
jgi:hypothetical protein